MDPNERIEKENQALRKYLSQKQTSIEPVIADITVEGLDKILLGLATMGKQIEDATQAARNGNTPKTAHYLGAGAKVTKDQIYIVLIEAYGGFPAIMKRGMQGVPTLLRDYIVEKYESGVRHCEFLLSN